MSEFLVALWEKFTTILAHILGLVPCCNNQDLEFVEGQGVSIQTCRNCGESRTYYRKL